ncbi:MAG: thioredoxin domain-containing protein [Thermoanaerobaculia bacterium]|nr:thioredoxin domain-containing protein [Thermoanaerobaculia bacterium]
MTAGRGSRTGRKNRLAGEISPYLLLHDENPVDWYPWGEEALQKARDEDRPIFLSVGYSTCYWCHVMERESFSDAGVAALMNESFVNVKVDREERPDIDEIYMAATQIFTQQGGWPNSVFLTPSLEPFFAGTYFPPRDLHGRPSFKTVLLSMQNAWQTRRDDVEQQATEMAGAMQRFLEERGEPADHVASVDSVERSKRALIARFDAEWGGFGDAPKFPSPSNLYFMQELAEHDARSAEMLTATLDAMAHGGIYDQLAGGFHRYATDREWKIPHFEKMLYDNGHLLELYARDYARTGDEERARTVRETVTFLERELRDPDGGFWSAIDAEVDGREGGHHVWTLEELTEVLGEEDAGWLAPILGFADEPFFENDHYVLHLPVSYEEQATRRQLSRDELLDQARPLLEQLLEARRQRKMPLVDDKVLTDWNGMVISGLAVAGDLLGDAHMVDLASSAADFVLGTLRSEDGTLLHSWRRDAETGAAEARYEAFLSDYVFLIRGLLALHDATGDQRWLREARRLLDEQSSRLEDPKGGFFTAGERPDVLFRSKEIFDGALPAANAVAALNYLEMARIEGPDPWLPLTERTLKAFTHFAERQPEGARMMALAVGRYHRLTDGPIGPEAEVEATVMNLAEKAARKLVSAQVTVGEPGEGGWRGFGLTLRIQHGWHVYADVRSNPGHLETLHVEGVETELAELSWPEPAAWSAGGQTLAVYEGEISLEGKLKSRGIPGLRIRFQPCDDSRCLASVTIEVEPREES